MPSSVASPTETAFAEDVRRGLCGPGQKTLSPAYFYDELGSALFEAITVLPEYGLTRADERLIDRLAPELPRVSAVAELGSGTGRKTRRILQAVGQIPYHPVDVSEAALEICARQLSGVADVKPIVADWDDGLTQLSRVSNKPLLLLFLGSTIGNLNRSDIAPFLRRVHAALAPGDLFLLGADLVKPETILTSAYDDAAGVTAAFNRNILGRINRELGADFDLRSFRHEARWNNEERRIEMHLVSDSAQSVHIEALEAEVHFSQGESIWTESSHKFDPDELDHAGRNAGFLPLRRWIDAEWPFVETLWRVTEPDGR